MNRRALLAAAAFAPLAHAQSSTPFFPSATAYSDAHGGVALVIRRNGVTLVERLASPDAQAAPYPLGLATRALAPLLAASLVDDRLMNLDEPVALTLGDWGADPRKSLVTIRFLLNGTSGVTSGERNLDLPDLIALAPAAGPSERFEDDAAGYRLFVEIARRKLLATGRGEDPAAYLIDRTLAPIGARFTRFARDRGGAPRFDNGAAIDARGWAAVGELITRDGLFRGRHIVSAEALRAARTGSFIEGRRGIGFWLAGGPPRPFEAAGSDLWTLGAHAPQDLMMAAGREGQRLYLVPSRNLVIARLASGPARDWSDAQFLARVFAEP